MYHHVSIIDILHQHIFQHIFQQMPLPVHRSQEWEKRQKTRADETESVTKVEPFRQWSPGRLRTKRQVFWDQIQRYAAFNGIPYGTLGTLNMVYICIYGIIYIYTLQNIFGIIFNHFN